MKRHDPTIATRRLVLRPPTQADLGDSVAEINDPRVALMMARVPFPHGPADAREFLGIVWCGIRSGRSLDLSIVHAGRVIGGVGVYDLRRTCELGYRLGRGHWGHGFATEAGRAVVAYGFGVLRLGLIRSGAFTDNPASLRVQMRLGFRPIGRSRRHSLARRVDVAHIDTVLTGARNRRRGR